MNVAQLCSRNVISVRKTDEVVAAALLMREHHVGYLVVIEPDFAGSTVRPIGVLTDRDIVVGIIARQRDPRSLVVGDVMTENPVVVDQFDSIATAVQEMRRIGVRRMPVVGSVGELIGVLSLDDVLDALAGQLQNLAGAVRKEQQFESVLRP
jgi:CBS domain-containing protein